MAMSQEIMTHSRADGLTDTLPANVNARKVVDLSVVQNELTGLEAQVSLMQEQMLTMQGKITNIKAQIAAAAVEAVPRALDAKMEIPAAPAISARKDCVLQPGDMVPGKGILIGTFDLFDAYGSKLGVRTNWYDAAIELGNPMTFNDTAKAVANCNVNGRGGLYLDPARYEAELFEELKIVAAMGKHVIAPLAVVKTIYALRNTGEYKRMSDGGLPGKLITRASGTDCAQWHWSCTPDRNGPGDVRAVDFRYGRDDWPCRANSHLSGRACFAELVP
jgi:hypothetical protein